MRRAGVAHSGQGALVCVDCTRRVICAVVSSTAHASRRSVVASGNKRVRTVVAGVEMKAGSSFHRGCLWATESRCSHSIRLVMRELGDIEGRTTQDTKIFQSVISPKGAKNPDNSESDTLSCLISAPV